MKHLLLISITFLLNTIVYGQQIESDHPTMTVFRDSKTIRFEGIVVRNNEIKHQDGSSNCIYYIRRKVQGTKKSDAYWYYNNIYIINTGSRPIEVSLSFAYKKTKRRLIGGHDYPLDKERIFYIGSASYTIPPTQIGSNTYYHRAIGILPTDDRDYKLWVTEGHSSGFEVTSINCRYAD